jgi:hypothetical protein
MAESIDISDHFEGYVTDMDPEPWDGTYPSELDEATGVWQIISEVMYVEWQAGNPCEIRTFTTHVNSGSYEMPDDAAAMFDDYNMSFADSLLSAPEEGSGNILAIGISDPSGAMDYVYNAIEDRCRSIEMTSESRGNFGVTAIKVA